LNPRIHFKYLCENNPLFRNTQWEEEEEEDAGFSIIVDGRDSERGAD